MRILFLESFFGGSHKEFAEGLVENSRHTIELRTLPSRYWKWRMRGAALHFVQQVQSDTPVQEYDLVLTTDLLSVSDLRALWPGPIPPLVLYMHENQLTYPVPEGERADLHFGFTDITSTLAADAVVFNSEFHRDAFLSELPRFLRKLPDYRPLWVVEEIQAKATVLYPGCRFSEKIEERDADRGPETMSVSRGAGPTIVWNHRWEFDKQPEVFFAALRGLYNRELPFSLVVLGENYQAKPTCFLEARETFADRIRAFGYVESRAAYLDWLAYSDIVVSTSCQENFGISVMEAMRSGCIPVLPRRLSYPELIPEELHSEVLYGDDEDLEGRLEELIRRFQQNDPRLAALEQSSMRIAATHGWSSRIDAYDELFEAVASGEYGRPPQGTATTDYR